MDRRRLGITELLVSPIGLGTVKIGRNQGVKYPVPFDLPTDDEVIRLLDLALDLGINLIDTAPAYGLSEARLGKLLPGKRDDWVIATKVGEQFIDGQSIFDFSTTAVRASVLRSLKRLCVDVIDIVYLHSDGIAECESKFGDAIDILHDLKREGIIRAVGASTKTRAGGLSLLPDCDVLMVTFMPNSIDDQKVIAEAHAHDRGIVIKKGLQGGHAISQPHQAGLTNIMQRIFGEPGVHSLIVGTINPDHLGQNVEVVEQMIRAQIL